ncbi:hypothetical protein Taro_026403, partial [Colocasia esculenta]|nr:hypothetical protein [Colocasia esculenta]
LRSRPGVPPLPSRQRAAASPCRACTICPPELPSTPAIPPSTTTAAGSVSSTGLHRCQRRHSSGGQARASTPDLLPLARASTLDHRDGDGG